MFHASLTLAVERREWPPPSREVAQKKGPRDRSRWTIAAPQPHVVENSIFCRAFWAVLRLTTVLRGLWVVVLVDQTVPPEQVVACEGLVVVCSVSRGLEFE